MSSPATPAASSCPDADRHRRFAPGSTPSGTPLPDAATKDDRAYHILRIDGYSRTFDTNCGVPVFLSGPFRAGGRTWKIGYYPRGSYLGNNQADFISLYLLLADLVPGSVKVKFKFSLLDTYLQPLSPHGRIVTNTKFTTHTFSTSGKDSSHGYETFVKRKSLGKLLELGKHDDCFAVRVDLRIIVEKTSTTAPPAPPSDMRRHLSDLLSRKEHTDVEFRVGEETFAAHRLLLGARSPVFKAQLLGPNKERETTVVVQIDDMEPRVFKAMLAFVYTDTWPEKESKDEPAMSQRLLVAADQYGMQRLKLMCESRLCNLINLNSVVDILDLAEKHQCAALKEACFDFIGSTATLLPAREKLLAMRESQELRFDRLVSLCPTITQDQISNVLENDCSCNSAEAIDITLDIE